MSVVCFLACATLLLLAPLSPTFAAEDENDPFFEVGPPIEESDWIPKTVYLFWAQGEVPNDTGSRASRQSWKHLNPNWEVREKPTNQKNNFNKCGFCRARLS